MGRRAARKKPDRLSPDAGEGAGGDAKPSLRRAPLLFAALALLALVGLVLVRRPGAIHREPGLSVLLITIDTLRADALGVYGATRAQTPWIDRLAAEGVRFDDAHAQNVVTLPSHANILSGLYPTEHGIRDNAGFRFPRDRDTLATILKRQGYRTGAFVSAFPLDSRFGLDRGFDVYDDSFSNVDTHTAFVMEERRGSDTVAQARRFIEAEQGQAPFFAWVHLYEPHFPYAPPEPFASRFAGDPYHGEVAAADAALGPLLEPLLRGGAATRTLVVLTSDHGESLGEHGEMTHGIFAYEATLQVPLILWSPRLLRPRVVVDPAQHVDLVPTVLDALGLPVPAGLPGASLLPLASGQAGAAPPAGYFESLSAARNRGWAPLYGLLRERVKYIDLPIPELYDLARDPEEATNLAVTRPELLDRMQAGLSLLRAGDRGFRSDGDSAEVRERLRSLGYVTTARPVEKKRYTAEDDPKRLIGLDARLQAAVDRYKSGDVALATALCEEIVSERPQMTLALSQLAFLYREAGNLEAALRMLERALAIDPEDTGTAALLGAYLNEAGQPGRALALLEPYSRLPDPDIDVVIAQGVAQAQLGRPRQALETFEHVRRIDPSNAMALVNIATVHLTARDYARAREALEGALALNSRLARAHNALGVIAAETGHPEEAIERWRRAVELEPNEFDTVYNLGLLLLQAGREAEARPYLERFVREAPRAQYARDLAKVGAWLASPTSAALPRR